MKLDNIRWLFIPGITGANSAIRCISNDLRFDILDLPRKASANKAAQQISNYIEQNYENPFIIIGNSYGSLVALQLARSFPDTCLGVVLINPPYRRVIWWLRRMYLSSLKLPLFDLSWLLPRWLCNKLINTITKINSIAPIIKEHSGNLSVYRAGIIKALKSIYLILPRLVEVLITDLESEVRKSKQPILVIWSYQQPIGCNNSMMISNTLIVTGNHFPLITNLPCCLMKIEEWLDNIYICKNQSNSSIDLLARPDILDTQKGRHMYV